MLVESFIQGMSSEAPNTSAANDDDDAEEVNRTSRNLLKSDEIAGPDEDENNQIQNTSTAQPGISDDDLINFVPSEPYGEKMREVETECFICYGAYEDGDDVCVLPCRHVLHKECLAGFLPLLFKCPRCLEQIPGDPRE